MIKILNYYKNKRTKKNVNDSVCQSLVNYLLYVYMQYCNMYGEPSE